MTTYQVSVKNQHHFVGKTKDKRSGFGPEIQHIEVQRTKNQGELGFKTRKVQKTPNRNDKQNLTAKTRALKLYERKLVGHVGCLILDDETEHCIGSKPEEEREFWSRCDICDYKLLLQIQLRDHQASIGHLDNVRKNSGRVCE